MVHRRVTEVLQWIRWDSVWLNLLRGEYQSVVVILRSYTLIDVT